MGFHLELTPELPRRSILTRSCNNNICKILRLSRNVALSVTVVLVALLVKHDFSIVHRGSVGLSITGVAGHENFEAVVDNYVYMHNALRNDLEGIIELSSSAEDISGRFEEWKDTLERHSKVEDEILIPALLARIKEINSSSKKDKLPYNIEFEYSHRKMVLLISKVEGFKTKENANNIKYRTAALVALRRALEEHLQEEEREVMPRMLQYFTYRELWALDSLIINPKLGYCPPGIFVRITLWWFRNICVGEAWSLLKNFVRAGNQPRMSIDKWEELRSTISALRDVPIQDLMS